MRYCLFILIILTAFNTQGQNNGWLKNVATTTRVSAQHYSEMACDNGGNVYIASFVKDSTRRLDFIYLVKIAPDGKKIWEKGIGQHGRAVSITIDNNQQVWITGYFVNRLTLGDKHIKCNEAAGFIAAFDTSGACKRLIALPDGCDAHNIHVNKNNNKLLTGTYSGKLKLGKRTIETNKKLSGFLAIFEDNGNVAALENINAYVTDVVSDDNGDFYLTGNFADEFSYQDIEMYTQGYRDKDGFLIKVSEAGEVLWDNQFGKVGEVSKYYTSRDAGCDLSIHEDKVIVPVVEDSTYENKLLFVNVYDVETGDLIKSKKIANYVDAPGSVSIEVVDDSYYLTLLAKDYCDTGDVKIETYRLHILKLNNKLSIVDAVQSEHKNSFMIRESTHTDNAIYFSGHYKAEMQIKKHSLKNNSSKNALFLYKQPL